MEEGEPVKTCTVCGTGTRLEFKHQHADLYRCPECDHCFSDLPSMRASEDYGSEYYEQAHHNWFEHPHIWLFEVIRQRLATLGSNLRVLDVGCGRGDFLRWLHEREPSWALTGIDLSWNASAEGVEFIQGDVLASLPDRTFDAVINLAVIEHVVDIHEFVALLASHCSSSGMIVIMTINDRSALYDVGRVLRRFGRPAAFDRLYDRHHLNHFNIRSLRRLIELTGLTVTETILHNTPMNAVDMPPAGLVTTAIWKMGVATTFLVGRLTGRTFLQTLVCRRPA